MQFTWYWHSLTTVVVQHADLKHNFEEYETYSLGWKVVEIHEDIKFNIQTNFLHYLVTFTQGINWIERDKYMNKNTSIITKHHSFWWLIIKSAGNFHNLVPKKSNNISQILWLIILTLWKSLQLLTCLFCFFFFNLKDNKVDNFQKKMFSYFWILPFFSNLTRMDISHLENSKYCHIDFHDLESTSFMH